MIVDLFAGAGGWDEGLRMLGRSDVVGLEWDAAACATRSAAGHSTIRCDVAGYPLAPFARGGVEGLIASPPCQDFSLAGRRAGVGGERGQLIHQVLRWAETLRPGWVACEQVPPALGIYELFAHRLRELGYRAWAGILNAADLGVPQTRRRAFLLASRGQLTLPEPTHAKDPQGANLFGARLLPWVPMATALGWGIADGPAGTVVAGASRSGGIAPLDGGSGARERYSAARREGRWTLAQSSRSHATVRAADEPAPTLLFANALNDVRWTLTRPATTVQGDPRIGRPGHKDRDAGESQFAEGSVNVTVEEAAALQSFPPSYPWRGSRTKQFEQVGDAVPPLLAAAVLRGLVGAGAVAS